MPENTGDQKPRHNNSFRNHMDRSQPSHYRRGSGSEPKQTKVRSDPWQSVSALQLGLHPRPFHELHTERICLLEMLQLHNKRALELFEQVPISEENIQNADTPYKLRQAKKNRGWLRHRITDTVDEEKKVLARLSELHVEIQCQERWVQVEMKRVARGLSQQQHNPNFPDYPPPPPISPWPRPNPPPAHNAHHSPYVGIVYPNAPSWDAFPNQGAYPGYCWPNQTYICPPNVPEAHHTPGPFEIDGTFTSNVMDDTSNSHVEVTARSPELEQRRPSTPPLIDEDGSEHNQKRCNSTWF